MYKTKRDLEKGNPKAYHTAYASPYWEELTDHMIALGNMVKRMIYVYEFPDLKTVYVGLTGDEDRRKEEHQSDPYSALYRLVVPLTWIGLIGFCLFVWYHIITLMF